MGKGLVIGKFYPPHAGHKFLIDCAQGGCEALTVLVCDKPGETLPASLRAQWLKEIHPDVEVRVIDDCVPDDDSPGWAAYTISLLGGAPDVVFTSEDYGEPYARFMKCRHVCVDRDRKRVPCSGTAVRDDPLGHWDYLEPCVRAFLVPRVCVLGAESTGTTTMTMALAQHFQTEWVAEYGREYWSRKMMRPDAEDWTTSEFVHIAREQNRREDEAARRANLVLFCDTDSFATCVWHERYQGDWPQEVWREAASRRMDLYLLTDVNIPFEQDGFRDGEHIRDWMHERFVEELGRRGKRWVLLDGDHSRRLATAVEAVRRVMDETKI